MQLFSSTADAVAATTRKNEKIRLVADYLLSRPLEEAAQAAVFFSGRAFPAWEERTLQVGGTLLWRALAEISGKGEVALTAAYRHHGDMGSAAQDLLANTAPRASVLSLADISATLDELARTSPAAQKLHLLQGLLRRATAREAKYIVKIIGGDLRIGLRESLVEEAIARAFAEKSAAVQRANMLLGDIRETLRLAAGHVDLVIETELKAYDVLALIPIITGAGGIITTWENGSPAAGGRIIAAGDKRVHAEALSVLRNH